MKSKRAQEAAAAIEENPADIPIDATLPTKKRKRGHDEVVDAGKKAKKDKKKKGDKESRKEKKEKRKELQDLPNQEDDETEAANGDVSEEAVADEKTKKKDKKDKKDKKSKKESKDDETDETPTKKKSKKQKKEEKKPTKAASTSDEATTTVVPDDAIPNGASNGIDLDIDDGASAAPEGQIEKASRHIVFVGNLPYTATAASISAHFASLSPIAVRCLTNKGDTKNTCKGIAFVEFANVWTQSTCLDRFHHSTFDDGQSAARKINVELSAGGGGTSENRREKIREKNRKLEENRAKRIEKEKATTTKAESGTAEEQQEHMDEQIHPSRRAQMGSDAPADDFQSGGGASGRGGGGRRGGWGSRSRGGGGGGRGRGGRGGGRGRRG